MQADNLVCIDMYIFLYNFFIVFYSKKGVASPIGYRLFLCLKHCNGENENECKKVFMMRTGGLGSSSVDHPSEKRRCSGRKQ